MLQRFKELQKNEVDFALPGCFEGLIQYISIHYDNERFSNNFKVS